MKTFRWTVLVVIVMFFIVGLGFMAWSKSAPQTPTTQTTPQQPSPTVTASKYKCPTGWHKKIGSQYPTIVCAPDKPKQPMECPEGTEYYECVKDGQCCEVGCKVPPPR
jgi:hypothetical protein